MSENTVASIMAEIEIEGIGRSRCGLAERGQLRSHPRLPAVRPDPITTAMTNTTRPVVTSPGSKG
ncbi:hypothetical protein [Actinosynnema sp. ALI-1.44]|uniref:hypothetical protein n=1 Tax=Actinosynnema sp. ALI-1.44 TaxID=1933779 RepID=UPI0011779BDB|nr:hypothetical protein [Actinosynnema sp. ALI-1.44]